MSPNASESSSELILDNRKLIIAFFLFMIACGVFFLIGFMEGKRQGQRARAEQSPAAAPAAAPQAKEERGAVAEPAPQVVDDAAIRSRLEWYGKVSEPGTPADRPSQSQAAAQEAPVHKAPSDTAQARRVPPAPTKSEVAAETAGLKYSVQVGAFRQVDQAESRASALKAKGYSCTVIPPGPANELYLVLVGEFGSRAEAVAMQLRLKKDGFSSFIKTSR